MAHKKKILICGAGIAGPTLAFWLHKNNFEVTVLEKAPELRLGGQNIDLSHAAVDVVKRMGLEPLIREHNTTEVGLEFVKLDGEVQAKFGVATKTFTNEYEILRGDLSKILFDATRADTRYIFGDSVRSLSQAEDHVSVEFESGKSESFDFLVAADGVGSKTRSLIIDEPNPYKAFGIYTSYLTIPKQPTDTRWAKCAFVNEGRLLLLRPDSKNTTRASVNFVSGDRQETSFTREESLKILNQVLRNTGGIAQRILDEMESDPDIYLGPVSQVRLQKWSKGRCVLLGDAAYCPTPFSGMGTTLAVIGAYVLAGELSQAPSYGEAFQNYDRIMRPYVEEIQKLPPGVPWIAYPKTQAGVWVRNKIAGIAASAFVQKALKKLPAFGKSEEEKFRLPVY